MKTYKFKMYSNHTNRELQQTIDSHAHVWNHFVALCRRYHAIYGTVSWQKSTDATLNQVEAVPSLCPLESVAESIVARRNRPT